MRLKLATLLAAAAFVPAVAQAQYFDLASAPNTDATPFWDVMSDDGRTCNIGYVLSGQTNSSVCSNYKLTGSYSAPYNTSLAGAWFAHSAGNVNASVGFGFFGGVGTTVDYFGGIAGATPLRSLFLRNYSTGTILWEFADVATDLANGGAGYGKGRSYSLTSSMFFDLGIGLYSPLSATPNSFSWTGTAPSQFAVFGNGSFSGSAANCGASGCWIGAEDISSGTSDYDYNDGVLRVSGATAVVPEPSTYALMLVGLVGVVAVRRRRVA